MSNINMKKLIRMYANKKDISIKEAKLQITSLLDIIKDLVKSGDDVTLYGTGKFYKKTYNAKNVNDLNGNTIHIDGYSTLGFSASKVLKF